VIDLIDSFERPVACDIEFESGNASGEQAALCEEAGSAG
jgi:hypothetical protein